MLAALARASRGGTPLESAFALCWPGRLSEELVTLGASVTILGAARLGRPDTVRRVRHRLRELLVTARPDVVILHLPWSQVVFGAVVRASGARVVLWMHGPGHGLHRLGARWPPDAVLCNSVFTRGTVPRAYGALPLMVLHYPATLRAASSPGDRRRTRAELGASEGSVIIVQASRLEAWKGHAVHLRALARLKEQPDWTLWVLGGASPRAAGYPRRLSALADELEVAHRVRFLGEQPDVARYLAAADVYCQPNLEPEPFGLAYVEALAAGLPVIASDAGGVREIVNASTGVLVPPGDDDALAAVLEDLIGDPALRRRLGAAGPARASELCDAARQTARLGAFLTQVSGGTA